MAKVATKKTKTKKQPEARYEIRPGFRVKAKAEVLGPELERIHAAHGGHATSAAVVDEARSVDSVLHPEFCWDDAIAAQIQREGHAGYLNRSLVRVVIRDDGREERSVAFVSVRYAPEDESCSYVSTAVAMSDDDLRSQVIAEVEAMLSGVISRYRGIPGLKSYLEAALVRVLTRAGL